MNTKLVVLAIFTIIKFTNAFWVDTQRIQREDNYVTWLKGVIDQITEKCEDWKNSASKNPVTLDKIFLMLYTSNGSMVSFPATTASDDILQHPDFKINQKTVIFSHGFNGLPAEPIILKMGAALNKRGYNLISFNSREYLARIDYFYVSNILAYVADVLTGFVYQLQVKGVPIESIHLVGHSLGAQISGMVARKFKNEYNTTLARITGLDPASPCFPTPGVNALGPDDAAYVDTIFTSILSYNPVRVGRAQFFVNGRYQVQPGCYLPVNDVACSHSRSIYLFEESVENDDAFWAKKCRDINVYDCQFLEVSHMGFVSNAKYDGDYHLGTNKLSPYGKGIFGLF